MKKPYLILSALLMCSLPSMAQAELEQQERQQLNGKKPKPAKASTWFPHWPLGSFDWSLRPLLDYRYSRYESEGKVNRSSTAEFGAAFGLQNISLVEDFEPNGVSVQVSPSIGWVRGDVATIVTSSGGVEETKHTAYDRSFGELAIAGFWKFYRHTLTLGLGLRKYHEKNQISTRTQFISNDFAVMLKPFLSGHLTHTWRKTALERLSKPLTTENDFWLHARYFTEVLSFYIDAGPGSLFVKEYEFEPSHDVAAEGVSHYFKMATGAHVFWKLGMQGSLIYVFDSDEKDLGRYADIPLPDQGLYSINRATMPEDSLSGALFVGLSPIFGNFGLGWSYNLNILNLNERDGKVKKTTRNHAWGLTYQVSI